MWTTRLGGGSLGVALAALALLSSADRAVAQAPLGSQFQVNTHTTGWQRVPAVAAVDGGDFVSVWGSEDEYNANVRARRYSSSGVATGSDFIVGNAAVQPSLAPQSNGNYVVAWAGYSYGTDPDSSIQARRYLPEPDATLALGAGIALLASLRARRLRVGQPWRPGQESNLRSPGSPARA